MINENFDNIDTSSTPIVVIGAGISGLFFSILLKSHNKNVVLIEKRSEAQLIDQDDKRSFNLTITERGMKCFREIDIENTILEYATPIKKRITEFSLSNSSKKHRLEESYSIYGEDVLFSIKRKDLIRILYEKLTENSRFPILFSSKLIDIDRKNSVVTIYSDFNKKNMKIHFEFVVGADGASSKTREFVLCGQIVDFEMKYFSQIYKNFSVSPKEAKLLKMHSDSLYVFPKNNSIAFAIPNRNQSFSGIYCCCPQNLSNGSEELNESIQKMFSSSFSYLFHSSPTLRDTLYSSKIEGLVSISLSKWSYKDKIILIGDSAHGIFPFYGQGMNSALQDCLILFKLLKSNAEYLDIFSQYESKQKPSTDALLDLCKSHFTYLSKKGFSSATEGKRRTDRLLKHLICWHSEYYLVSQTDLPYDKIAKIIKNQKLIRKISGIVLLDFLFSVFFYFKRKFLAYY